MAFLSPLYQQFVWSVTRCGTDPSNGLKVKFIVVLREPLHSGDGRQVGAMVGARPSPAMGVGKKRREEKKEKNRTPSPERPHQPPRQSQTDSQVRHLLPPPGCPRRRPTAGGAPESGGIPQTSTGKSPSANPGGPSLPSISSKHPRPHPAAPVIARISHIIGFRISLSLGCKCVCVRARCVRARARARVLPLGWFFNPSSSFRSVLLIGGRIRDIQIYWWGSLLAP